MSDKKLSFLGITAVISVVLAVFVGQYADRKKPAPAGQGELIQGLDPATVAEITIKTDSDLVKLKRVEGGFALVNKYMYPAANTAINDLLAACLDIKTVELYTKDSANHKDLSVAEENAKSIVKFLDSNGAAITGLVIGNSKDNGMCYARLLGSDDVYLVDNAPWIKPSPMEYIEAELLSVKKEEISSVKITLPNEKYEIIAEPNSGKVVLNDIPAGKKQKDNGCSSAFYSLTSLYVDDVNAAADMTDLNFDVQYTCLLNDSSLYTIWLAQKDSKTYIKCQAEFTDKTPVQKEQSVESQEELKKKEAKLLAKEKVVNFNNTCTGWIYRIPEYKARSMTRPKAELIEDIESAKPQEAPEKAGESGIKAFR
ncbi:MAG: DUF4340 domain-containing protein [Phycisphaerae bacterium]|nr:DUF4340 domain-containing protein [Phycisphaerae bacterium]